MSWPQNDEAIGREDQIYAASFRRHPRCDATRRDTTRRVPRASRGSGGYAMRRD